MKSNAQTFLILGLIAAALLLAPGVTLAQQYYDPGLLQKTVDRKPVDYQSPGMRAGSFVIKPGAELAWENNDNIYYGNSAKISDDIFHVRPWVDISSDWSRHAFSINAFADIAKYSDFGSEDYEDYVLNMDGRVDVKRGSHFDYRADYMSLHEERSSPDDVGGIAPTEFSVSTFGGSYRHQFNRMSATLSYDANETDYDNNVGLGGAVLDNQDRNRDQDSAALRLDFAISDQAGIFVSFVSNNLDYDQPFDDNGFARSSNGSTIGVGVSLAMTGVLTGDISVNVIDQEYDDPRFANVDGVGIDGNLNWTPRETTHINLLFSYGPQETTQALSSGYVSQLFAVRLQHEFRRNLLFNARLSFTDNDYQNSDSTVGTLNNTEVTRAGFGISYLFNRRAYLSAGWMHETQDANEGGFDYDTDRYFLTFGWDM